METEQKNTTDNYRQPKLISEIEAAAATIMDFTKTKAINLMDAMAQADRAIDETGKEILGERNYRFMKFGGSVMLTIALLAGPGIDFIKNYGPEVSKFASNNQITQMATNYKTELDQQKLQSAQAAINPNSAKNHWEQVK